MIKTTTNPMISTACLFFLIFLICSTCLTGCAAHKDSPSSFSPTARVIEKTVIIPPPDLKTVYHLEQEPLPALKKAYQEYLKTGKALNITTEGFIQFAYFPGMQPIIGTCPLALTVISLEPGENVISVSSGDPLRWSYSLTYSGSDKTRTAHVLIKPSQSELSTDLVITTDKRMYTLKMTTVPGDKSIKSIKNVRFWYPQEIQSEWNRIQGEQVRQLTTEKSEKSNTSSGPEITLSNLNFDYQLTHNGWKPPVWTPIRVFDDGRQTYIQFDDSLLSQEMPVLFVFNDNQDKTLVNYRFKSPYFVVDQIFQKAVLVSGTGKHQSIVTLIRGE